MKPESGRLRVFIMHLGIPSKLAARRTKDSEGISIGREDVAGNHKYANIFLVGQCWMEHSKEMSHFAPESEARQVPKVPWQGSLGGVGPPEANSQRKGSTIRRVAGLDSLRFFCAVTVIFFHRSSPPIFSFLSRDTPAGRVIRGLYDAAFNGQAAVITFFVISGFCIHFPYASGRPFSAFPFLLSRAVRILIPTGAFLILLRVIQDDDPSAKILLWSVVCELIYYGLYPALRFLFARTSVLFVLLASYAVAAVVVIHSLTGSAPPSLFSDGEFTWLAGMPCWILGCLLAERFSAAVHAPTAARLVWVYRAGAAGLGFITLLAMLHFNISLLISLHVFAVFSYFWIRCELEWHLDRPANRLSERLGSFTFSIYLIHGVAKFIWGKFGFSSGLFMWAIEMGFVLLVCIVFFALVERPSHLLARMLAHRAKDF